MKRFIAFSLVLFTQIILAQTPSSGSGSHNLAIQSTASITCPGGVCTTDGGCIDNTTGMISPITLSATFSEIGNSTDYAVESIPFNPPFNFNGRTNVLPVTFDDTWSDVIDLASINFDFCFFGNTETEAQVGSNGVIRFDVNPGDASNGWAFTQQLPNNTNPTLGEANILGACHDIDPAASGAGTYEIGWEIAGVAPFRAFVFSFFNVAHFQCNNLRSTQMMVFYETTNIIEVYILTKPTCTTWNNGSAVIGIQNDAGTVAYTPPGRNTGDWTTQVEAWQFRPNGGTPLYTFEWVEQGTGTVVGTDPSNLTVSPSVTTTYLARLTYTEECDGMQYVAERPVTVTVNGSSVDPCFTINTGTTGATMTQNDGTVTGTFAFNPDPGDGAMIDPITGEVTNAVPGTTYNIIFTDDTCNLTCERSFTIGVAQDPSFTMTATCDGGTATVTGTAGGTFAFNPAPSDTATIDTATGTVTGGTSGATYTVEYTTPDGMETSTQTVTVLPTDDASFTVTATCDGGTATVTGSAGGTFAFNPAPTDGATIDASTGAVTGGTSGASYTIDYTTAGVCPATSTQTVTVLITDDASFTMNPNCDGGTATITGTTGGTFAFNPAPTDGATLDTATGEITNGVTGTTYTVEYTTAGACPANSTQTVTVLAAGDASFNFTATCDGATATITGEAGGVFTFNPDPGDGATLDAATGAITNGVAGATYTVDYNTSGACPANSTETVTVLPNDDGSFTVTATCSGGTATISGTTGGTFAFNPAPTDGATIDAATGAVSGGVSGASYTIEYTTSGVCPATTTQTLTILTTDDPSFTLNPNCDGGTATITGTTGGTFAFNPAPGDGATLDTATGEITNGVTGATYTVEYTTSGVCPSSSTEMVTVLAAGDATFTLTPTCDGATATIVGEAGGVFSFNPDPGDGAVLDTATGAITNAVSGATYTLDYVTTGACPANSTETVTSLITDDGAFTVNPSCDGGTATVTGTPGGTFAFNPAPTDMATIDAATGTVTGGTSGASYTIEYTTPGVCPVTTTQVLTLLTTGDASFTLTALCDGATATITGETGGVFAFNPAPTDGATIDATTGAIANGVPSASYTVEYTTTGACPATSSQTVTVLAEEDASFTLTPTCDGATATIAGNAGGTFSFMPDPGDGANLDAATGTITNGMSAATYTVQYVTGGPCPDTVMQTVTVLTTDDASFTVTPSCDGGTATIAGTTGGTFAFNPAPTDTATIDAATGLVSAATSGASYTIEYTTSGVCPVSSTQTLTVLVTDDPSFTLAPTCDGGTATVSGTTGGTFTFDTAPTDAATIDATTGTIANGTPGATYTITYTTSGVCPSNSTQSVTAHSLPTVTAPTDLLACDDATPGGTTTFTLTDKDTEITGGNTAYTVSYHASLTDAQMGTPTLPTPYLGTNGEVVFVRVVDTATGCYDTATLTLQIVGAPAANIPPALTYCDPDNDTTGLFNLNDATPTITTDPTLEVTYHLTEQNAIDDALAIVEPQLSAFENNEPNQVLWVRVDYASASTDCPTILQLQLDVNNTPQIVEPQAYHLCDDDADGFVSFNLQSIDAEILNGLPAANYSVTYYIDVADAEIGITAPSYIANPGTFINTLANGQTLGVRVEDITGGNVDANGNCYKTTTLQIVVDPLPVIAAPNALLEICDDSVPNDGTAVFDLTTMDSAITGSMPNWTVDYYVTAADLTANTPIPDYTAYENTMPNQTIFVKVTDTDNTCYSQTTLTLSVLTNPTPTDASAVPDIVLCDTLNPGDLVEFFDLTLNQTIVLNGETANVTYHTSMADAEAGANAIPDPTMYENTNPSEVIYVRLTNANVDSYGGNCYATTSFNIIVNPIPNIDGIDVDDLKLIACELDGNDIESFDLTQNVAQIETWITNNGQTPANYDITFYTSLANAESGMDSITDPTDYLNELVGSPGTAVNPQTIYVRIQDAAPVNGVSCALTTLAFEVEVQDGAVATNPVMDYVICDNTPEDGINTGFGQFNLTNALLGDGYDYNGDLHTEILSGLPTFLDPNNYTITFYSSMVGAQAGAGHVDQIPETYQNETAFNQTIYIRVDNDARPEDICYDIAEMNLIVNPLPVFDLDESYTLCVNTNGTEVIGAPIVDTTLDTADFDFTWFLDGVEQTQFDDMPFIIPTLPGEYTVTVTNSTTGCNNSIAAADTFTTNVILSSPPTISAEVVTLAFSENHAIEAFAEGDGEAEFEFSLNDGPWLAGEVSATGYTYTFSDDVLMGQNTIKVRDINGCGSASITIEVMDYPLFFTPNGDGFNDTWNIASIDDQSDAKIFIYDRYGKLLKQINPTGSGWNGTYNGEQMPASDYWFTVEYREPNSDDVAKKTFKAHFTLKR